MFRMNNDGMGEKNLFQLHNKEVIKWVLHHLHLMMMAMVVIDNFSQAAANNDFLLIQ